MATRRGIIDEARTYINTPFHHQGRIKGVGVDCIGLISGVAKTCDIFHYDNTVYPRYIQDEEILLSELRKVFVEIPAKDSQPGDVVVFWVDPRTKHAQHVGIKTDVGVIHTYDAVKRVVETHMNYKWEERITHAFEYPGVEKWQP